MWSDVTDLHIHVAPWDALAPAARALLGQDHADRMDFLEAVMGSPALLLQELDRAGIWRVGLINAPSPEVLGLTDEVNDYTAAYAAHNPVRLLAFGGVHPRHTRDATAAVDRLIELGIVGLKIHPPHQGFPANAYTEGLGALAEIYRRAEDRGLPVMIHTGTSVFPGARCKYGRPMELDDVAVDFPDLRIIMAHGGRPLWMEEAFFLLRRHSRVWLDLSGIPPLRLLEWFPRLEEIGERVAWGSDWPGPGVRDFRANLEQFLALPLPTTLKRRITVEAALELFPSVRGPAGR